MIALNSTVAAQLISFKNDIDKKVSDGMKTEEAIFDTLRTYIRDSKSIRFEGNGYSNEWEIEASERGLNCEKNVPLIYDSYTSEESVKMFESIGVLNETELHARNEVKWKPTQRKFKLKHVY